ncbi:MAG: radical SAM protein [Candidatus Shapirobacteria bacterium]|jgi:radical SAM superfamily enzyme YgiQ (UPF0313 family)
MKNKFSVSISYPPLESTKGSAFLSQNRQFQWGNTDSVFYPVIMAYAATLLKKNDYQVFWDDAIAERLSYQKWLSRLITNNPDLVVIETKTPVVKKHWQIISDIKDKLPKTKIALIGDHVTALPQESISNSKVDFVLTGGDYDFMILNLADQLSKNICPDKIINTPPTHLLTPLPIIDRNLTKWYLYSQNNTNYKYKPGAYIMSGRDCWWGRCTFCSWTTLFPGRNYRRFSVDHTIKEINNLVVNFGVKEVFDDAGTLPVGDWLQKLCQRLIDTGLNRKVKISCNMRFGALTENDYQLMAKAGFRFILYGLESANPQTIEKINKNIDLKNVPKELKIAKKCGLEPHITIMIGYPWETKKDAQNTLNFAKKLFRQGIVDSMQATIVIPYPGTPLFDYCQKNNLLNTKNWDNFDMRQPVIKSPISSDDQKQIVQSLFKGIITPRFMFNKIKSIKSLSDLKFLLGYTYKFFRKLKDFKKDL